MDLPAERGGHVAWPPGHDRPPPDRDDHDQDQSRTSPMRQQGRQGPEVVPQASGTRRSAPMQRPGTDAVHRVGARRLSGDQRKEPRVVDTRRRAVGARDPVRPTHCGTGASTRLAGTAPRPARRAAPRTAPTTASSATISSECDDPEDRAITGSRRRSGATSATIRVRVHDVKSPRTRGWDESMPLVARPIAAGRWPRHSRRPGLREGGPVRPGRDPRTGGTRTTTPLHCTTRNSRMPAIRTRPRE